MKNSICLNCSNPFEGRSDKLYCSQTCKNEDYKKSGRRNMMPGERTVNAPAVMDNQPVIQSRPTYQGMDPFMMMVQQNLADAKEEVKDLKRRNEELTRENHKLSIEKGTFEKTRELDQQSREIGLQGANGEMIKDLLFEVVDLGKSVILNKMTGPANSSNQFGEISDNRKDVLSETINSLDAMDQEAFEIMMVIINFYMNSPDSRLRCIHELNNLKQGGQKPSAPKQIAYS